MFCKHFKHILVSGDFDIHFIVHAEVKHCHYVTKNLRKLIHNFINQIPEVVLTLQKPTPVGRPAPSSTPCASNPLDPRSTTPCDATSTRDWSSSLPAIAAGGTAAARVRKGERAESSEMGE